MNPLLRQAKIRYKRRRERRQLAAAGMVIVSFPKSGRTWLRTMIGSALCRRYGLPEADMLDLPRLTRAAGVTPTLLSHDGASNLEASHAERLSRDKRAYRGKKVVLLVRDPRDTVTSCYFQASRRRNLYRGSLGDFVRDPRYGIEKILTHLDIWAENRSVPKELLVIRYEDLKTDPMTPLRGVLEMMGVSPVDDALLQHAIEFASFENMKALEQGRHFRNRHMRPRRGGDPEASKVRRGKVGGHLEYLSPDDLEYCNRVIAERGPSPLLLQES